MNFVGMVETISRGCFVIVGRRRNIIGFFEVLSKGKRVRILGCEVFIFVYFRKCKDEVWGWGWYRRGSERGI